MHSFQILTIYILLFLVQDALWSGLLLDSVNLPLYIESNRTLLASSYLAAITFLDSHDIPYRPSNAGHFIWIDLRRHLPTHNKNGDFLPDGFERETELALRFAHAGVNVVCLDPIPYAYNNPFSMLAIN